MLRSIAFSRATASAICNSSSRFALTTAMSILPHLRAGTRAGANSIPRRLRFPIAIVARGARGLAAPERFGDQRIGQYQPRLRHVFDREAHNRHLSPPPLVAAADPRAAPPAPH